MKYLIASDLHGGAASCKKLIESFEKEKADKLILLGDLLYHGPRNALPKSYDTMKTAELLNSVKDKIICVRGNCDAEVDQMVLEFDIMQDYVILPYENLTLFFTHGHHYGPSNLPPIGTGDILFSGHTHVPCYQASDWMTCVNPGSTTIPKGGSVKSYLILENKVLLWKDLSSGEIYMERHLG